MEHLSSPMPTIIHYGGRNITYHNQKGVQPLHVNDADILGTPAFLGKPRENDSFVDGPWNIRYRKIQKAHPDEHWMDMPTLRKLVRETEEWVTGQVQDGAIDAAMVRGSTVPLFRIRDPKKVLAESTFAPQKTKTAVKAKKEKWDRE